MTKYNCGVIGSLVYRAQGYKRLRNEVTMASQFFIPDSGLCKRNVYYLVSKNIVARNVRTNKSETLKIGSLVVINKYFDDTNHVEVKLIDYEKRNIPEEVIFHCSSDSLIQVNKKVWKLIAAVSSPLEKIKIAKDTSLCEELCNIEVGSVVEVAPASIGIVKFKGPVEKLGPGIFFGVEILDNLLKKQDEVSSQHISLSSSRPNKNQVYVSADQLTLNPSCKKRFSEKISNFVHETDFDAFNDQNCSYSENRIMEEKTNFNDDARFIKTVKLRAGNIVYWLSETGVQRGTICWKHPVNNTARIHLGDSICKITNCERSQSIRLPVCDLKTEEEYLRRCLEERNHNDKKNSVLSSEIRVGDLLGIRDQQFDSNSIKNSPSENHCRDYIPIFALEYLEKFSEHDKCSLEKKENIQFDEENKQWVKDEKSCVTLKKICKCDPSRTSNSNENLDELGVGSVIEVSISDEPYYGVIKWIGSVIYGNSPTGPLVAGVELEEENHFCSNGVLNGHKYFDCAPHRGFFSLLSKCKKDSRFQDSSSVLGEIKASVDFGSAVIPGIVEPINQIEKVHSIYGKYKGIQGHNNSCYLDATLFSMFAFTSVFDNLLLRPAKKTDIDHYKEVQQVLREEIVNPLRKNQFVRADRVMNLRTLLDNLTSVTGLTCEEKDPEEFLTSLVAQVLKADPFLKLSSGHEAYYYQLFVEKDEHLMLPTVQQLFEQSLITSDIKLKEVPSCLIIQMPRFGKSYKMYPRILPSQLLDVTDVIENSPRQCTVCGELAEYECKECFKHYYDGLQCFSYCQECAKTAHTHEDRVNHECNRLLVPSEFQSHGKTGLIPRQYMELFAVLCIETSHYVAFVKCGMEPDTPWCFFDSMADREGGLNGFNIPEIVLCADLPMWLSEGGIQSFCAIKDDRHLPTYAKRLLCDAYMCLYQSTDVMMYR